MEVWIECGSEIYITNPQTS